MEQYQFRINVSCEIPDWLVDPAQVTQFYPDPVVGITPMYRLYVNDDLLTERTWIWNKNTKIKENVLIELEKATRNNITLEAVKSRISASVKFVISGCESISRQSWEVGPPLGKPVTMRLTSSSNLLIIT
jgi:hypothetical protein